MFALASVLLFAGGLASPFSSDPTASYFSVGASFFFIVATGLAIAFFVFGMHLLAEISRPHPRLLLLFVGSIVGAAIGFIAFIISIWSPETNVLFVLFFSWGFLPYVPWISGPVAMVHGFIFALKAGRVPRGSGRLPFQVGCVFLVTYSLLVISAAAAGLAAVPGTPYAMLIVGATCLGYVLVRIGLGTEYEDIREHPRPDWFKLTWGWPQGATRRGMHASSDVGSPRLSPDRLRP